MRFLICGLGSIGIHHFDLLRSLGEHTILAYRTMKTTIQKERQPDMIYYSLNEALDQDIDGVLVTNPTFLHIQTAQAVAEKGIPLLIEKPLSHNMDDIDQLNNLCQRTQTPVLIGNNIMFHPAIIKLKELVKAKAIGDVICSHSQFGTYMPDWHPWEDYKKSYAALPKMGGGVVLTSIHEINYITDFWGYPNDVLAIEVGGSTIDIRAEEGVEILMKHPNGIVSNIHLNFFQRPNRRYFEIIGSEGTLFWDFWKPDVEIRKADRTEIFHLNNNAIALLEKSYRYQMEHFISIISENIKPRVGLKKGIQDVQIAVNILKQIGRAN